jgi:hypothetical protein
VIGNIDFRHGVPPLFLKDQTMGAWRKSSRL